MNQNHHGIIKKCLEGGDRESRQTTHDDDDDEHVEETKHHIKTSSETFFRDYEVLTIMFTRAAGSLNFAK